MRFVTFHTTKETWSAVAHPYGGRRRPHTELIALFLRSIRASHPGARVTILTDRDSDLPGGFDEVVRAELRQDRLMLARLEMQRAFLRSHAGRGPLVYVDTDTLVVRPLAEVFDGSFDVGVTIRDDPRIPAEVEMPYNNGVILVDRARPGRAEAYFDLVAERVRAMPPDLHAWSGNQHAVRDLLGRRAVGEVATVEGVRVRIFPCTTFNYTPVAPGEPVADRYILHFKGPHKVLMAEYAGR